MNMSCRLLKLFFFCFYLSIDATTVKMSSVCLSVSLCELACARVCKFVKVRFRLRQEKGTFLLETAIWKFSIFLDYDGVGCLCFFRYVSSLPICVRARPYVVFAFPPLLLSVFMKDAHIIL